MRSSGSPRIVLVGGTGFTGGLVAREVLARGLPLVLTGRDPEKVARRAEELEGEADLAEDGAGPDGAEVGAGPDAAGAGGPGVLETGVVDAADPRTLGRLLAPGDVVANCAGPFSELGHPVVRAAVQSGAHYLDTTGEQGFMMETARRWHGPARERGVAVVNALAFEYAPGDAACAVAAERVGASPVSLDVTYAWRGPAGGTSPGTRASILRVLARRGLAYEGGEWREEPLGARRRRVRLDGRERTALSFPAGEVVTAGRDASVDRVRGWLAAGRAVAAGAGLLGPLLPPAARALRPLLEPLLRRSGPREPSPEAREASEFLVRAEARGPSGDPPATEELRGRDPYGLTARLVAEGARALLEARPEEGTAAGASSADGSPPDEGSPPAGVLRPSALLPPRRILREARS